MNNKKANNIVAVVTHPTTIGIICGLAVIYALSMTGCNTVKGMAKDLYSVTEGIQDEMGNDTRPDDIRHNDWD